MQRLSVRDNVVTVSGTATATGFVASFAMLSFDDKHVRVLLDGGMTPFATQAAISSALPEGYRLQAALRTHHDDSVSFQIVKNG
ncbi:MAG: hypothetical protein H6729_15780 [Deltaproteobacteria bacterium]|nr:hypothetical protein [Deltaproteobacteria bacterium]